MTNRKKRSGTIIAVAWERDYDDNRHPLVIVHARGHEIKFYDHPTAGWQMIALAPADRDARRVAGAEDGDRAFARAFGAPLDWGRVGIALAHIAEDLYAYGWHGAGERWQGKRIEMSVLSDTSPAIPSARTKIQKESR